MEYYRKKSNSKRKHEVIHTFPKWVSFLDIADGWLIASPESASSIMASNKSKKISDIL